MTTGRAHRSSTEIDSTGAGTVLLLDGQTTQALPVMRSLKHKGFRVVIFCDQKRSFGYYSRYADRKLICPEWTRDKEAFREFFFDFVSTNRIDCVIPMNDYSAVFLSEHLEEVNRHTRCLIPGYETFMNAYDKNRLMGLCRRLGIPHPASEDLEVQSPETAAVSVGFPAIIKPNITTGARGMKRVDTLEELLEAYPVVRKDYGPCHLQKFVQSGGKQFKVQIFTDQMGISISTVIEKIRYYPVNGGSSCCNVTIENDQLVAIGNAVLNELHWVGFADFDLIEDPEDGEIKVMEINPRIPACIRTSFESGVDFAEVIVNHTLGLKIPDYQYHPGDYLRYFGLDLLWFLNSPDRFRTKPGWFRLLGKRIYYQDGSIRDPMPFIMGNLAGILKQLNPGFRKAKSGL